MTMKSLGIITLVITSSLLLGACETKKKPEVKVVKTERVVVAPVKPTLESLDHRVTVLEEARARANANAAKAKKYSPAPKYDPNYKG